MKPNSLLYKGVCDVKFMEYMSSAVYCVIDCYELSTCILQHCVELSVSC